MTHRSRPLMLSLACAAVAAGSFAAPGCAGAAAIDVDDYVQRGTRRELVKFRSEKQLRRYVERLQRKQRRRYESAGTASAVDSEPSAAPAAEASADADDAGGGESITNTQEAGVDEGGIVKAHGELLVVLRRGRLFTVRLGDRSLQPVSKVDVTPPGKRHDSWYDEMLLHDDTIVVVGYSYQESATELALFDLDDRGRITYRNTYFLRSNDYYSSRNYASRLTGDKLVFYMPYSLVQYTYQHDGQPELAIAMPSVRRHDEKRGDWSEIIEATDIYEPIQDTDWPVLHTVVTCDLKDSKRKLRCSAQGIIGPYGRTFYVSQDAVYVWVSGGHSRGLARDSVDQNAAVVYRLPLDGKRPGALRVWGAPIDQFSFKQSDDGHLNVLVRAESGGDWMWSPEAAGGDVALLRVPVGGFDARVGTVKREAYTPLPRPKAGWVFQNRFVGDHVLYGTGSGWGYPEEERDHRVFVHPYRGGGDTVALELMHGVDRIEALGSDAVVVGTDGTNLNFTALSLAGRPRIADRYVQEQASQGELRSHGFFYKPTGPGKGVLGLPVRSNEQPGYAHLVHGSAEVLYLEVNGLTFRKLGALASSPEQVDDSCVVSCVDWYGNARPIFYRGRVFALLGYELVEGRIAGGELAEVRRVSFLGASAPQVAR